MANTEDDTHTHTHKITDTIRNRSTAFYALFVVALTAFLHFLYFVHTLKKKENIFSKCSVLRSVIPISFMSDNGIIYYKISNSAIIRFL